MRITCAMTVLALLLALTTLPALAAGTSSPQSAAGASGMSAMAPGQMYGIVTSVNPSRNRFMISTSNRVIYVSPSTRIMSAGQAVPLSDLHTGMGVTVAARPSGRRLIASSVSVGRSAVAGAAMTQLSGVVTSVNPAANRLMISTSPRVIYVTPDTSIVRDNQRVSLSQVQTGMNVTVSSSLSGNRLVASSIDVSPSSAVAGSEQQMIQGQISAVDTANNTITLSSGETIALAPDASIMQDGAAVPLSSLRPGMQISASMQNVQGAMQASSVTVSPAAVAGSEQRQLQGTVASVDAANNTFTLDSGQTISVDANTSLMMGTETINLSQLKPGDVVSLTVTPMGAGWLASQVMVTSSAAAPQATPEMAPESPPDQSDSYQ